MASECICCCSSCWRSYFLLSLYDSNVPRRAIFFRFLPAGVALDLAFSRCKVLPFFSVDDKIGE